MSKDSFVSEKHTTIEKLEEKIRELESANQRLQEYFAEISGISRKKSIHSPFSGNHYFESSFRFAIDIEIQRLVWVSHLKNTFAIKPESLFLKDVDDLSVKLIAQIDREYFQDIIVRYLGDYDEPKQAILRINHPGKKFVWALARFEKQFYPSDKKFYIQAEFIELDKSEELLKLYGEFIKKHEKAEQYQKVEALTKRQREILSFLGKGYTSKEIADLLKISFHTVEAHRKIIAKKTNIRKRAGLICLAADVGIIS